MFSFLWWHQFVHRLSRSMTFHQHEKQNHGSLRFYRFWDGRFSAYGIYVGQGQTGFGLGVGADEISLFEIFFLHFLSERNHLLNTSIFLPALLRCFAPTHSSPKCGARRAASRPTRRFVAEMLCIVLGSEASGVGKARRADPTPRSDSAPTFSYPIKFRHCAGAASTSILPGIG